MTSLSESPVDITCIDFSPFGEDVFLVGCDDGTLKLYSIHAGNDNGSRDILINSFFITDKLNNFRILRDKQSQISTFCVCFF